MSYRIGKRKNEKGQAAIEFIAVVVVIFFFLLFFLSFAFLMVVSDYIDYATFMAARTYKSGFSKEATQEQNAKLVFDKYFEKIAPVLARKPQLKFIRADPNNEQTAGVIVQYEADMFYMPPLFLLGAGGEATNPRINLQSEVHLGRDPTYDEVCSPDNSSSFFMNFLQQNNIQNPQAIAEQMDDNGC